MTRLWISVSYTLDEFCVTKIFVSVKFFFLVEEFEFFRLFEFGQRFDHCIHPIASSKLWLIYFEVFAELNGTHSLEMASAKTLDQSKKDLLHGSFFVFVFFVLSLKVWFYFARKSFYKFLAAWKALHGDYPSKSAFASQDDLHAFSRYYGILQRLNRIPVSKRKEAELKDALFMQKISPPLAEEIVALLLGIR